MEWPWLKNWWRLKKWRKNKGRNGNENYLECFCDDCFSGDLELCDSSDTSISHHDMEENGKQVVVGVCAMAKKSQSKPMKEILTRLQEFEYIKVTVFPEDVILEKTVDEWPVCDCLISFHSKGFPLDKAIQYASLHNPYVINNLHMQYDIQDRRKVYAILESEGIEIPRYAVLDRDSPNPKDHELIESEDHVEVNGVVFNKPFVEKPVSAEDHNIYIYYPTSAGGGSQRLFRKIGSRSSVYSPESRVRKTGSYIYEDFMPTDGTDVKVYTVGPDYAHAEARKSPALDGKVERDREGKEIRYPVILSNVEKLISRKVCLAFKQAVCGFDLLRANGKSFVCDVNGFSFVKNSNKYYDDCAKILGNMILRELAPTLHIPWSVPFQLDDPPIVPTTFGKMMELRCVVAVIRHGDRTPKQKMKVEVRHPKFFEIFEKYDGYKQGHVKLKRPKQLQEILDIARSLLAEIQQHEADPEIEEKQGKLEQLKSVLEMYGHFSGINRKVQMKYQPKGRPRGSSSEDGKKNIIDAPSEPSLVLILKWGGELTPAGRIQAEELGRIFRCMYPGGQGRHLAGEYAGAQGLGLLRLHSTFRHDLKIYASDEGRVQMTAAAFAKGLLALEGELTPILVQMVKSANTNGLLDNDCDSSKYQNMCKSRLHELMQLDREFSPEEKEKINPCQSISINTALDYVKNPVKCCRQVHELIKTLLDVVRIKRDDPKTKDTILYHGETWELMGRRWGKIEKDFCTKSKRFDISKIPDIYDCIKYDLQHNQHTLQFEQAEELYLYAKYLADIVIPQEYGLTVQEKLTIGQGICTPLLKKIKADLQRNIEESEETVNRLNPRYSHGVSSPGRHVRTRLYFTSESHVHSLITCLRYGGLLDVKKDEQWRRAMEYISMVSELNYMSQVVIMLYEDPTKDPCSEERFHVELHFSPGVNCCVQKNLPPGPGFRPHSRNDSSATSKNNSTTSATENPEESKCSSRIEEETVEDTSSNKNTDRGLDFSPPDSPDYEYSPKSFKTSNPIPIGSAHTVSGHEAMHLAKQLNEELAQQKESRSLGSNRASSPEPRSKSYENKNTQTKDRESPSDDTDLSVTPTNTVFHPALSCSPINLEKDIKAVQNYVFKPIIGGVRSVNQQTGLSPISGSFEYDQQSEHSLESPLSFKAEYDDRRHSLPDNNETKMPLTVTNLQLFTSELSQVNIEKQNNNVSNFLKQSTVDTHTDDTSLEVNWESDDTFSKDHREDQRIKSFSKPKKDKQTIRSFSDPNILDIDDAKPKKEICLLEKLNETLFRDSENVPSDFEQLKGSNKTDDAKNVPFQFGSLPSTSASTNTIHQPAPVTCTHCCFCNINRNPPNLLSFFTSPPKVLTTSRSFSHPVPFVTVPTTDLEASCSVRRHRHSIAGQMSYFKMLGFSCGGTFKKLTGGSANSLFSTAVISGSSSAPNLRDMIPSTASASAIEGIGGVPPIRPLETLHNALSLRQIDSFLEEMTAVPLFKTPSSTPPKYPSTPIPTPTSLVQSTSAPGCSGVSQQPLPLKLQSPNNSIGWSGPPSLISSNSGPSSPAVSEQYPTSKESSEMSSSIISTDGVFSDNMTEIYPSFSELDQNLGKLLHRDDRSSVELSEIFQQFQQIHSPKDKDGSGELTPISGGSDIEFNTNDATAGSTADIDLTVTEDIVDDCSSNKKESSYLIEKETPFQLDMNYSSAANASTTLGNILTTDDVLYDKNTISHLDQLQTDDTNLGSELHHITHTSSCNDGISLNYSIKIKHTNPLRISRTSKSFHGKTTAKEENDSNEQLRRASEECLSGEDKEMATVIDKAPKKTSRRHSDTGKVKIMNQKGCVRSSTTENLPIKPRFTMTLVDEADHAATMGSPSTNN
ncbi:inositol hexakisphosphate and diphosphoinositol-pentakisphosphate kinase 2 isoform X4 [Agrilus planipennis]|uniref:Inositol hexakisphosphate and diphosphoinositol-pentakisphosphate kinase n=1 Tax=Agrilus planipennis TaxID=224129 RepID=A0A7F5RBV3_AGRPL|nr:inositol hexakisphosphate and diphosphoinositol-pentakisphosphate kinase 2 isoform X4 [Agrilus planipennis]